MGRWRSELRSRVPFMSTYVMRIEVPRGVTHPEDNAENGAAAERKKFEAKSVALIAKNFLQWRNRTFSMFGVNTIGTHWPIRYGGRVVGELTYDGAFWPDGKPGRRPCDIVEDILAQRFTIGDTHSPEYRAGVRVALEWRLMRAPMGSPYESGTAQADAFILGLEEGRKLLPLDTPIASGPPQPNDSQWLVDHKALS